MVTGPCILFPQAPLKFHTAGFPQYGFKPALGRHLRRRAHTASFWSLSNPASVCGLGIVTVATVLTSIFAFKLATPLRSKTRQPGRGFSVELIDRRNRSI